MNFTDLSKDRPIEIVHILENLRNTILGVSPHFIEAIGGGTKFKSAYYYIQEPKRTACLISPANDHVKIFLHYYNHLNLSRIKLQGTGKHTKHFKLTHWDAEIIEELKAALEKISLIIRSTLEEN